ncbi:hypothetical protein Mal4_47970 [Maioricimonas rarisocia]|uniref:GTPase-associated protein 1 N-terminal domain-containing protein n=1 Tax=Maioricimonas rarisocia TaxID=2528026 RepID=A0A517ZDC4_9PLAN|nr:hypothetical protein [Maioricimonas rarisocia]QDU40440.1 hypothetical protein Mal4_47970 [Maioricimonas rarisocia]
MIVEQAVFTSVQTRSAQGYHLVARSPGVNERLAQTLAQWGPSQGALVGRDVDDNSLSCFATDDGRVVLMRSVYGGPEYSGRGSLQVVTYYAICRRQDLAGYDDNSLRLARVLLAQGHLRLQTDFARPLASLDLPDHASARPADRMARDSSAPLAATILEQLDADQRIAVVGAIDAWKTLEGVLQQIPAAWRLELSFTTGLNPSVHRRFLLHFLPEADTRRRSDLQRQGIMCVDASPVAC